MSRPAEAAAPLVQTRLSGVGASVQDTLVLVYNMACPLRCDFCCHPVEQYGATKMEPSIAIGWIRQAAAIPTFRLVAFTGGEPFLYHADLLRILGATQGLGLELRIVTAAHWAESLEVATDRLRPLVEAGLTQLTVSSDPSHQEFVPASYAQNATQAALAFGLRTELAGIFWDASSRVEDTIDVPVGALTSRGVVAPIGRARAAEITPERYGLGPERFFRCGTRGSVDVTVYPDGEVYPCCSGGFNIEADLSFGNLRREQLAEIVSRMHEDRYVRLLLNVGLGPIWELAQLRFPEVFAQLPELEPYTSICQACVRVHTDRPLMQKLQPVLRYAERVFDEASELDRAALADGQSGQARPYT